MAGIIDGEGSICIFPYYGRHYKYGKYPRYKPALCVTNTNRKLMEWIVENFGGTIQVVKRKRDQLKTHKQNHHWLVSHEKAANIIRAILPYLVIKREQADLFLTFQATARRSGLQGTPEPVRKLRSEIAEQMRELNRRGPPPEMEIGNAMAA